MILIPQSAWGEEKYRMDLDTFEETYNVKETNWDSREMIESKNRELFFSLPELEIHQEEGKASQSPSWSKRLC